MDGQSAAHEGGKRRSQRSSEVLQDYLKGLDSDIAGLVAQREYIQAKLELVERQRANLQEVIEIEGKLAEMDRRGFGMPEKVGEGAKEGEVAVAS
jgi:Asp-tRNA(Asn)/Glu-tRNA(Gln) amidotransferase B subunit